MLASPNFLGFYSIWLCWVVLGALIALAATRPFAAADTPPSPSGTRISTIDGLRGLLALGVFFHHAAVYHAYIQGNWALPPSRFYTVIGLGAVEVFFMITGYLFWGKLLADNGRPDWVKLYAGRIFRIGPLYLAAVAVMLVLVADRTGWGLHVSLRELAAQLARWLSLGWCGGGPDLNGLPHTVLLLAGTPWTLAFEWKFYLSLLPLALLARTAWAHLPVVATALAGCLVAIVMRDAAGPSVYLTSATLFLVGMLCAALERSGFTLRLPPVVGSVALLVLAAVFGVSGLPVNAAAAIALFGAMFYLVVCGADLFGILLTRPVRRLGNISYGIYLLQGLVLTVYFSFAATQASALASPLGHWVAVLICGVLLLIVATVAHAMIERPGIDAGRRVGLTMSAWASALLNRPAGVPVSAVPPRR